MARNAYCDELERLAAAFRDEGALTTIRGDGVGSFMLVEIGLRGAELYWGDDGVFVVDPAVERELLGEVGFSSVQSAIDAIKLWLNEGVPPAESLPAPQ